MIEAIATFLRALSHGSRHMLNVGHPGCPNITSDERQMLAIIAASQAGNDALLLVASVLAGAETTAATRLRRQPMRWDGF